MTAHRSNYFHPRETEPVQNFEVDLDKPRYNQKKYLGRARHFFIVTNPFNIFVSKKELHRCVCIIHKYRNREKLPECITVDQLWKAKHNYDSAFHPETGEKMTLIGRMSAQVPINTFIAGGMMIYHQGRMNIIFWQLLNQSFNAVVNFTNRSGGAPINNKQLVTSYLFATAGAIAAALSLKDMAKKSPPTAARLVPFAAVAAANMINIPFMRSQELKHGLLVTDKKGRPLGYSKVAAQKAISAVTISRILMALPGMVLTPIAVHMLQRRGSFCRYPWLHGPTHFGIMGATLLFTTPLCCAIFKQKAGVDVSKLEPRLQRKINCLRNPPRTVYYNKGL